MWNNINRPSLPYTTLYSTQRERVISSDDGVAHVSEGFGEIGGFSLGVRKGIEYFYASRKGDGQFSQFLEGSRNLF